MQGRSIFMAVLPAILSEARIFLSNRVTIKSSTAETCLLLLARELQEVTCPLRAELVRKEVLVCFPSKEVSALARVMAAPWVFLVVFLLVLSELVGPFRYLAVLVWTDCRLAAMFQLTVVGLSRELEAMCR
jgi:hypothetical protein